MRYVVFDEADTMFSERAGFLKETQMVVDALRASTQHSRLERPVQFVLAAATPDRRVETTFERVFPVRPWQATTQWWQQWPRWRWWWWVAVAAPLCSPDVMLVSWAQGIRSVFEDQVFRVPDGLDQEFVDVGGGHNAKHGACKAPCAVVHAEFSVLRCAVRRRRSRGRLRECPCHAACPHGSGVAHMIAQKRCCAP